MSDPKPETHRIEYDFYTTCRKKQDEQKRVIHNYLSYNFSFLEKCSWTNHLFKELSTKDWLILKLKHAGSWHKLSK